MHRLRNIDIKYIKGIGPKRAELLTRELGIHTAYDLLHHFPTHYIDRSRYYTVRELVSNTPQYVLLRGRFVTFNVLGEGVKIRLVGLFSDGTATMEVVWFKGIKHMRQSLTTNKEYILFGKPGEYMGQTQMSHPEIYMPDSVEATEGMRGVYPLTERLRQRGIGNRQIAMWVRTVLDSYSHFKDPLPALLVAENHLCDIDTAIRIIHNPTTQEALAEARLRLKFEEVLYLQVDMLRRARKRKSAQQGYVFARIGKWFNMFYSQCLPFELTGAQKRVIKEIRADVRTGKQMNRLVQGDVGSGKTLVALMAMLMALDNGYQACLMAPTEILATQHYETLRSMAAPIGLNIRLLTGSTKKKERDEIHAQLLSGELHIIVGTHALLEDTVQFKALGIAVIDEQHRFGVAQRARLWAKSIIPPHILVMTATPIPRTLAMTVYGDLDVSVIDELPPGRKPVTTLMRYDTQRLSVYQSVGRQLAAGRQAYIVYPLIDENDKLDLHSLQAGYEEICETFPSYKVAFVHGRLKPEAKDYQMGLFASGDAQILVATTVIEVGVNVPNATVMIIENAERFGLSQLHQLRGRVGRGAQQSYCVLMTKYKIAADTRRRLELMTQTSDGFVIAEADMEMRGPGDIEGTMQSGLPMDLHIINLAKDGQIIAMARSAAEQLLDEDSELSAPANQAFKLALQDAIPRSADWGRIS